MNQITLAMLIELFMEDFQRVVIYSTDENKDVYKGTIEDLPAELLDTIVQSIDSIYEPTDTITINISEE